MKISFENECTDVRTVYAPSGYIFTYSLSIPFEKFDFHDYQGWFSYLRGIWEEIVEKQKDEAKRCNENGRTLTAYFLRQLYC